VPVGLVEIAGGLPLAASFAFASGISTLREGRRRSALNEALHEVRRPLQALALADPSDGPAFDRSLQLATAAVERLDREINGGTDRTGEELVEMRPLVEAALARWRPYAERLDRSLALRWGGISAAVIGDPVDLSQALDNLIINGLEHGTGAVSLEAIAEGRWLRLAVRDAGRSGERVVGSRTRLIRRLRTRLGGRSRHGHGLRVVRRTAAELGGGFHLCRGGEGTAAVLELPVGRSGER
jgi:signal transduction histidine kinase